ncbi:hypothetical protein A9404_10975 [Halothiobacillus diazotrophicus]|uniref:Bifunctional NAD(P)H-hydrate repair enzyme n=1 Tax=Halothiobacillus diazotrophicus TaxID=1860122 RepID=A0A191ZJ11_9GAMM|nr:bifunctional ADP-dependent NAD(P)H-hydrate dehydratase/NAD(P)H-hydrate epimerase [Halothiobacillus diazotrophicus]ANJ67832.1 hypothetical protein A9404_10975 [Halothiobacillus diazotrophicus]
MNDPASPLSLDPALLAVFSAAQIRAHEAAIFARGTDGYTLMDRAGASLLAALRSQWPEARHIAVVVGVGQNAGDGLVVARRAVEAGLCVDLFGWQDPADWSGAAAQAWQALRQAVPDIRIRNDSAGLSTAEVIVDALFGIGLNRPIDGPAAAWIAAINAARHAGAWVIAADLPSGLLADTGQVLNDCAVHADLTVSFLGFKPGLFTGRGPALAGRLHLALLGQAMPDGAPMATLLFDAAPLPPKPRDGHKGTFGTVLVVGGNRGMGGAARMAGESALRLGAGKVILAVHPEQVIGMNAGRPELMVHGVDGVAALISLMSLADAVVLGPGLGQDDWAQTLALAALAFDGPMIVDADGLRFLSPVDSLVDPRAQSTVLTPHPAEAGRLLNCSTADVQADRFAAARALQARFGGAVLLKGAGSVLALRDGLKLCGRGDPALATAGTGDILSGMVGALLAMGFDADEALGRAVCWHAIAGEIEATASGSWGMAASDLLGPIRALANAQLSGANERLPWLLN